MIELGIGFDMDMAARDNVIMNGIMLGLSPREARRRYDACDRLRRAARVRGAQAQELLVGHAQVRLAFSVAIQVDADLLLIDEILAVGDASPFSRSAYDVFNDMRDAGEDDHLRHP